MLPVWRFFSGSAAAKMAKFQKKGFPRDLSIREKSAKNHECATDGCTVGHLYLSQMIFGQGDPWSLV